VSIGDAAISHPFSSRLEDSLRRECGDHCIDAINNKYWQLFLSNKTDQIETSRLLYLPRHLSRTPVDYNKTHGQQAGMGGAIVVLLF
jgi:hypothetical protein